ncbi:zinc finger protein CONSTANS-LIKE 2-like [Olea europaea var. sylvestris]|uniref:zinc finger protein CONSTANS-LIKE 2-like n=1 Tax=Olea europaea var. sylvestris TaxID=158386 RepID=UPI000C1D8C91|nr:zinc finger protein CONSTANS-LIKE 2-like [Olea europaea var. sylvestris]
MLKEENGDTSNNLARMCDTCQSAPWTVYCRADAAYLCIDCDARIHAANGDSSRHERVWVCEACESAPAAFLCKADAASLCTTCDSDVHLANPLARRHKRIPILPIPGSLHGPSAAPTGDMDADGEFLTPEDDEAASWLLLNRVKKGGNEENNNGHLSGEVDEYIDLNQYNSCQEIHFTEDQYKNQKQNHNVPDHDKKLYDGDSVVPVQYESKGKEEVHQNRFQLEMEYEMSNAGVSLSSLDVGVVPESRLSEVSSVSQQRPSKGTIYLSSSPPIQMPTQLSAMDREARVLRYREKKKKRKFQKMIRYATRKAYAETRPRIKGRFAKRTDSDQMFSTSSIADSPGYGIVPSF